jgi:hypothetical protein
MRVVAMTGRLKWTGPAATTLLVIGGVAAYVAAKSGLRHTDRWSASLARERRCRSTRNGGADSQRLRGVGGARVIALALSGGAARTVRAVSRLAVSPALACSYEAAEHGGTCVTRTPVASGFAPGNPEDVGRLLVAGSITKPRCRGRLAKGRTRTG